MTTSLTEYVASSCVGCCKTEEAATRYLLDLASDPFYGEAILGFVRTKWEEITRTIKEESGIQVKPLEVVVSTARKN